MIKSLKFLSKVSLKKHKINFANLEKASISFNLSISFLILYTIEMGLKILGMGFIISKNAYLRDAWNILDFIIVSTAYLPYLVGKS